MRDDGRVTRSPKQIDLLGTRRDSDTHTRLITDRNRLHIQTIYTTYYLKSRPTDWVVMTVDRVRHTGAHRKPKDRRVGVK